MLRKMYKLGWFAKWWFANLRFPFVLDNLSKEEFYTALTWFLFACKWFPTAKVSIRWGYTLRHTYITVRNAPGKPTQFDINASAQCWRDWRPNGCSYLFKQENNEIYEITWDTPPKE